MATREQWRERLLGFELPKEVVDTFLATIKDEDLVRMKEYNKEEFMALLKEALSESEATETQVEKPSEDTAAATSTKEDVFLAKVLQAIGKKEITVEVPELVAIQAGIAEMGPVVKDLSERVKALEATMKEATQLWKDLGESDTERLRGMVKNMSPAQKARLSQSVSAGDALLRVVEQVKDRMQSPDSTLDGVVIKDAQGNLYRNLGDMAAGRAIGQ